MRKRVIICTLALTLAGCATPYQEKTFWSDGGVSAKQVSGDTLIVTAQGNPFTDPETVQAHALRKAADATLAAGMDWFMPLAGRDRSSTTVIANSWGSSAFATPVTRPGESMTVRIGKNPRPDGAMDAREVIAFAVK
jgi:hypothetical protein